MRVLRSLPNVLSIFISIAEWSSGDILPVHNYDAYQDGAYGDPPQQIFHSSNIIAPVLNYGTWSKDHVNAAEDGSSHVFLTLGYKASGPYIFRDDDLSLVYADPSYDYAMNARVQSIDGTQYLSFWHGARNRGDSQGFCVFYDQHYQLVYNVTLGAPFHVDADMHECEVTPDGTVLLTAYQDKPFDLTPLGGKVDHLMADGCFQEIRVETGEILFSWCASDWFDVGLGRWNISGPIDKRKDGGKSYTTSEGFDVYHINSLQKVCRVIAAVQSWRDAWTGLIIIQTTAGHYLVSLRNLWLLTYVDGETGKPIWNLGGNIDEFEDITPETVLGNNQIEAASFSWQHHARIWGDDLTQVGAYARSDAPPGTNQRQITLFDNHQLDNAVGCVGSQCSRGCHIQIDTFDPDNLTKQLVNEYRSPHGLSSVIYGSMQPLSETTSHHETGRSSILLGWGVSPEFTEHTGDGQLVRDVQYSRLDPKHSFAGSGSVSSYRVFKQPWHGYPTWPPEIAITENGSLWVSWNGATEVRSWALYAGDRADLLGAKSGSYSADQEYSLSMGPLRTVPRQGFETEIEFGGEVAPFVKVAALNAEGEVIGTTKTLETGRVSSPSSCLLQDTMSFTCLIRLLW